MYVLISPISLNVKLTVKVETTSVGVTYKMSLRNLRLHMSHLFSKLHLLLHCSDAKVKLKGACGIVRMPCGYTPSFLTCSGKNHGKSHSRELNSKHDDAGLKMELVDVKHRLYLPQLYFAFLIPRVSVFNGRHSNDQKGDSNKLRQNFFYLQEHFSLYQFVHFFRGGVVLHTFSYTNSYISLEVEYYCIIHGHSYTESRLI